MNDPRVPKKPRKNRKKSPTSGLSGSSALIEALSIARDAQKRYVEPDPEPEIDWTRDPLNERESKLRDTIMRRVETEARLVIERGYEGGRTVRRYFDSTKTTTEAELVEEVVTVARHVAWRLESLVIDQLELDDRYDDDYRVGKDLGDRIEHWKTIEQENDVRWRLAQLITVRVG